jgi:hypothetical protein
VSVDAVRLPRRLALGAALAITAAALMAACGSADPDSGPVPKASASTPSASAIAELDAAIAGIDAAVYAYGVIGANLRGSDQRLAKSAMATLGRQRAAFALAPAGVVDEAAVAYALPGPVPDAAAARALAALVEMRLIPYFDAVAAADRGAAGTLARVASVKAAARAQHWAGTGGAQAGVTPAPTAG